MGHSLRKFRKGFIIVWLTLCIIILIMSLISYFIVDEFRSSKHQTIRDEPFKFNTLLNHREIKFNGTWVSDSHILMQDETGNIILYNMSASIKLIIASNSMPNVKNCYKYELSMNKNYLLIGYNVGRTSSGLSSANYDVINVETKKQVTLADANNRPRNIMATKWSPIESNLIIVDNYNIYFIHSIDEPNNAKQITFHGSENLYHGIPDWMYREEIFHSNSALWFSTRGNQLAYARFNETLVPSAQLSQYDQTDITNKPQSKIFNYRYPKVTDTNPTVELFVQNIDNTDEVPIQIRPTKNYPNETILYQVAWSNHENLFVMWMNRIQNESHLVHYHILNNAVKVKRVIEFEQNNGWLDFRGSLLFNPKHHIAMIYPIKQESGKSYRHVCLIKEDGIPNPLIRGKFEVTQLVKWDFEMREIYFLGHKTVNSEKQDLYRVTTEKPHEFECLTCYTGCDFSRVEMSKYGQFFAHVCTGWKVPYVSILNEETDVIMMWELNKELQKTVENVALPHIKFITVPLNDDYEARVKLIIPPTVKKSSGQKYPLLIHTHGEPSLNLVLKEFKIDLDFYLCANHDFIVAQVDGRGTSRRGSNTLFANYKKIGTDEIDDHLQIAKYLQKTTPYVDERKTGIWGWGYGGYVAGMVLARDEHNVFKCALSVAPITDWTYHNSVFTERLMGTFKDNFENYKTASLIEHADGLRHKNYMLIHGLSDTEVHFQHSAMFSEVLRQKNIEFEQKFYSEQSQKLLKVKSHLYRAIISFMLKYLT